MTQQLPLEGGITEILEPNLQFYRRDNSDERRYFVGPEVLHGLAWAAMTIALPIFLSATNELIKEKLKKWLEARENSGPQSSQTVKSSEVDLTRAIADCPGLSITETQVEDAESAIAEYLDARGWPKTFAHADAREIVALVRTKVESRK